VREGNVSSVTPPPQPHPGNVGPFAPPQQPKPNPKASDGIPPPDPVNTTNDPVSPTNNDQSWRPGATAPAERGGYAPPPPPSRNNTHPPRTENIADGPRDPRAPAPANIPNGPPRSGSRFNPAPAPPRPVTAPETSLGPPPSNNASGSRVNFTLYDARGEAWQFKNAHGRLVLLDFWHTECAPCLRALPEMRRIAGTYGASGLEVVGVACQQSGTWDEQVREVSQVAYRNQLNYRVLHEGEGSRGEARRLFEVRAFPTMVLLDRQGNVLWRGVGASRENLEQLEATVKRALSRR
jgi:thiol-disulfide isomerase/thioredoxin